MGLDGGMERIKFCMKFVEWSFWIHQLKLTCKQCERRLEPE